MDLSLIVGLVAFVAVCVLYPRLVLGAITAVLRALPGIILDGIALLFAWV